MKVCIISSSSSKIEPKYIKIASDISDYLANKGLDLVYGGGSISMMGACYNEFIKNGRKVYAFTTKRWENDLNVLNNAYSKSLLETTFDLKKELFENSDFIIALPGSVGTFSELLSFIEENRSNCMNKPIEIYNENDFFKPLFELLDTQINNGFTISDIYKHFSVANTKNELYEHIEKYINKKEKEISK